jgi:type VI secretion system protein ImpK
VHLVDSFVDVFSYVRDLVSADAGKDQRSYTIESVQQDIDKLFAQKAHLALEGGYQEEQYQNAKFAVVAWLDEQILSSNLALKDVWVRQLAQKKYFNTMTAGQAFFSRLNTLDLFDAFELDVREVFYYCLTLGFHGQYYQDSDKAKLVAISKENYQILNQAKNKNGTEWFEQTGLQLDDVPATFKKQGWAFMLGLPLLIVVTGVIYMKLDLMDSIHNLVRSL